MAKGGFDDFEMENMGEKYPEYDEMNNAILESEFNNLIEQSKESTFDDRDIFKKIKYVGDLIEKRKQDRNAEYSFIDEEKYDKTAWIGDEIDYKESALYVLRTTGKKENLSKFINNLVTEKGLLNKKINKEDRKKAVKFIRSYLAISDGSKSDGSYIKPLMNNHEGVEIMKHSFFARGGSVKFGGLTTFLNYKGVDVRMINTTTNEVKN